ncbi:hypothetical protein AMELA_G00201130 [Ameiurus melas]|uniref:Sushi domain-containing protein n=1 Tax=Ameiurus melas TaxID=219545 RepID=A0A7J6A6Z6_AMEME|nr:hypothetical protein AMELA_G00201130 [Ameiurus melas]
MLRYMIICSTLLMTAVTVRAQCERPDIGENQILTEHQQTFPDGSTVKFKCSTGYIPVETSASTSITCTGTQWSDLELQCKKKSCGHPDKIPNLKYIYQPTDGILFGATITAECNEGYLLVGPQMRNCRVDGWDGRAPVCEALKCPKPPGITDGTFEPEYDSYDYGEAITYSCNRGLDLIGPSVLTCSGDGTFQPSPPRCLLVSCERPEIPNAVRIEGKSPPYKYNNLVRYQCNEGYRMSGSDYLTCKEDGWNPPPPQCNVITCSKPAIKNGTFNPQKELYEYRETVTCSCDEGFILSGASTISCTDDGTFETSPQCLKKYCGHPGRIPNGKYIYQPTDGNLLGATITAECHKGYLLVGPRMRNCRDDGWDGRAPVCEAVKCPKPPGITDGTFQPEYDSYYYDEDVTYSCKGDLDLIGPSVLTCSGDGTFQPSPPRCQ